jgi:hypothetical protein
VQASSKDSRGSPAASKCSLIRNTCQSYFDPDSTSQNHCAAVLAEAWLIDKDGVFDPCRPNNRLLLGMKGSISEFELGVLRDRMLDAACAKARRGELRISVPVGYIWHREIGLGFDPDLRLQEVVRLIIARFRELGSAQETLLSLRADCGRRTRPRPRPTSPAWSRNSMPRGLHQV